MLTKLVRAVVPDYGYSKPTQGEILAEFEKTRYTPDISKLEEQPWHLVFVCDEFKKDHLKHHLLGEDKHYAGPAYTQKMFRFWDKRDDPTQSPIPMKALETENGFVRYFPPLARIKGELWYIRPLQFLTLDTEKQNTVEFRRQRVTTVLPHRPLVWLKDPYKDPEETRSGFRPSTKLGDERVYIHRPWMYLGRRVFWEPHLTAYDFQHVPLFPSERQWCKQFYHVKKPRL